MCGDKVCCRDNLGKGLLFVDNRKNYHTTKQSPDLVFIMKMVIRLAVKTWSKDKYLNGT